MAFSSSAVQPVNTPVPEKPANNDLLTPLLGMLMLSVYAAHKSKKAMRKMKRRFLWTALKLKAKSMFSKEAAVSDKVIIYILIGIIALILVFYYPLVALLVALVALLLILAHVI